MQNNFLSLRELAPSADRGQCYSDMGLVIGESIGATAVVNSDGTHLGDLDFGGEIPARVVVQQVGISRQSGGDLFEPVSLVTQEVEHVFIKDLPVLRVELIQE